MSNPPVSIFLPHK